MKGEGVKWQEGLSPEKLPSKNPALLGLTDVGSGAKHIQYKNIYKIQKTWTSFIFWPTLIFGPTFEALLYQIESRSPCRVPYN